MYVQVFIQIHEDSTAQTIGLPLRSCATSDIPGCRSAHRMLKYARAELELCV